ncbi:MAG TPA: hypothetical protein VLD58_09255, partial [Gemmatimonadales bacterium]|nr:hypothetical protein [Gemmatimonadales bacterium]
MRRQLGSAVGLMLSVLVVNSAAAQWNVARFDTGRNRMYTTFGLDPAFVSTVGYGRVVRPFGHSVQLTGDIGLAAAHLDTRDFRARLGMQTSILHWRSLRMTGSATFITRGTENSIYRALNFGSDLTGTLGVYRHGWFAAGEFGFDKAIITHLTHSDWSRKYYYPDAKDGWYLNAGGVFHYGATAGVSLGRVEVSGRFGWRRT